MFDLQKAIDYGREVLRVEQIPPSNLASAVGQKFAGREVVATIYGNDRKSGAPVSFGQVLNDAANQTLLTVIRGTSNVAEWIDDAKFLKEDHVESGFNAIYKSLRVGTLPGSQSLAAFLQSHENSFFVIAGHSLGGALASILAVYISNSAPLTYTFASPKSGDEHFASLHDGAGLETHRIFNKGDVVPDLPSIGYKHVGAPYELIDFKERNVPCRHHLQTYLHILTNKDVPVYPGCE